MDTVEHRVRLAGYRAHTEEEYLRLGTWGSYGIERLLVTLGGGWQGLAVTATFHPPDGSAPIEVLLPDDGQLEVPPAATARPPTRENAMWGKIVWRGVRDGAQIISCDLLYCLLGHAPAGGSPAAHVTPDVVAQILAQVQDDRVRAELAADLAAGSAAHPPVMQGGTWWIWHPDGQDGSYVDTGLPVPVPDVAAITNLELEDILKGVVDV